MSYNHVVDSVLRALNAELANETDEDLFNSTEFKEHDFCVIDCPICGHKTMDMYWICSGCGWEYDIFINYDDNNEFSDCNGTTLGEYKNVYRILRDVFKRGKVGYFKEFYLITCYRKDCTCDAPTEHTYGAFDSFKSCVTALSENCENMHNTFYDFAVVNKIDMNSNIEEIKWFVWDEEKQGFFETNQEADWSSGWVNFNTK